MISLRATSGDGYSFFTRVEFGLMSCPFCRLRSSAVRIVLFHFESNSYHQFSILNLQSRKSTDFQDTEGSQSTNKQW